MLRRSIGPVRGLAAAVVAVLALLGWLLWPSAPGVEYRAAQATVLRGSACGAPDRHDVVLVDLGGRSVEAELQGCGHRPGEKLDVEIPAAAGDDGGRLVVRLAGTGVPAGRTTEERLAAVLAVASGAGGAALAWRLGDRRLRERRLR